MSSRRYFDILGIPPTKNENLIKRAYRKKAMKYHPDRNPSAAAKDKFIQVTEAYDQIILALQQVKRSGNKTGSTTFRQTTQRQERSAQERPQHRKTNQKTAAEVREDRIKEAQKRYENMKRREALENERYYQKITTGKRWKRFKITMYACTFFALLFTLDQFVLPTRTIGAKISEKNVNFKYAGESNEASSPVIFDNGQKAWISLSMIAMEETNYLFLERTFFFRDIKYVKVWRYNEWYRYTPDYSLISTFPLIHLTLLLPLLGFYIKGRTIYFSMLFNTTTYLMPVFLIAIMLSNDRWAHLITLGIL